MTIYAILLIMPNLYTSGMTLDQQLTWVETCCEEVMRFCRIKQQKDASLKSYRARINKSTDGACLGFSLLGHWEFVQASSPCGILLSDVLGIYAGYVEPLAQSKALKEYFSPPSGADVSIAPGPVCAVTDTLDIVPVDIQVNFNWIK